MDLIVLAKEPVPGRVKTRLTPPCDPGQAAALAAAALADTLGAAIGSGADRVLLALDGQPGPWIPPGVRVVDQGSGKLDQRLARAWAHTGGPALQVGMDTPQVSAEELDAAFARLLDGCASAVLGPAEDGGWWGIGLRRADPTIFLGVPTSRPDTGRRQLARLRERGLRTVVLPTFRDVDRYDDAVAVAAQAPTTCFARCLAALEVPAA